MDETRFADLIQLYHEREGKTVAERDNIDRIRYNIQKQDVPELNRIRQELVGSVRARDGKASKRLSEKIKHLTHQIGMEHHG